MGDDVSDSDMTWRMAFFAAWFSYASPRPYMTSDEEYLRERGEWSAKQASRAVAELGRQLDLGQHR